MQFMRNIVDDREIDDEVQIAIEYNILLGGCCISPDSPDYACPTCGRTFIKTVFYDR